MGKWFDLAAAVAAGLSGLFFVNAKVIFTGRDTLGLPPHNSNIEVLVRRLAQKGSVIAFGAGLIQVAVVLLLIGAFRAA